MALVLDIMRHGEALPPGRGGDRQRSLSPAGFEGLQNLGAKLAAEGWNPGRILASPLRRALETAVALNSTLPVPLRVEPLECLQPDSEPLEVLEALLDLGIRKGHVLIVGHQPLVGLLVLHLTGDTPGMPPGTLVRVECPTGLERGKGRRVAVMAPRAPDTD
jgi:phosphohistidine phosphatase